MYNKTIILRVSEGQLDRIDHFVQEHPELVNDRSTLLRGAVLRLINGKLD